MIQNNQTVKLPSDSGQAVADQEQLDLKTLEIYFVSLKKQKKMD
jgi:hypothetical protein